MYIPSSEDVYYTGIILAIALAVFLDVKSTESKLAMPWCKCGLGNPDLVYGPCVCSETEEHWHCQICDNRARIVRKEE